MSSGLLWRLAAHCSLREAPKDLLDGSDPVGSAHLWVSRDCNLNKVPDSCDIDDGTLDDLDENGLPDPCEEGQIFNGGGGRFKRGDCDGNGTVSALLDSRYLLIYAFASGDAPPCLDAADCDGNDAVSGLVDSLFILDYAFGSGDAPPSPGPTVCGTDPEGDSDGVDCLESGDGCF